MSECARSCVVIGSAMVRVRHCRDSQEDKHVAWVAWCPSEPRNVLGETAPSRRPIDVSVR